MFYIKSTIKTPCGKQKPLMLVLPVLASGIWIECNYLWKRSDFRSLQSFIGSTQIFLSWKKKKKKNWRVLPSLLFMYLFFWQDKTKFNWVSPGKAWCYYGHCILLSWIASDSKLGWTEIFPVTTKKWKGSARIARALRSLCGLNQSLALHCRGWRQEKKFRLEFLGTPESAFVWKQEVKTSVKSLGSLYMKVAPKPWYG